jgi:hypothetical protein
MTTVNLFNTYNTNTTYTTEDVVFFNGNIYQANVVCQGIIPTNTSYWRLISGNFSFHGITFKGVWSGSTTYSAGEYVTYNGTSYLCNTNNNLNHTPSSSSQWTVFNVSLVTSQPGDLQYQGASTLTRLPIGTEKQVLAVSPSGYPAWTNFSTLLPTGNVNQILTLTDVGVASWSDAIRVSSIVSNTITSNTSTTGVLTSTSLSTGSVITSGNVTIGGNLYVTGTTTTINTDIFQSTEYANIIVANVSTIGVLTSNIFTSNTITTNTISSITQTTGNLIINYATSLHEVLEFANVQNIAAGSTMNIYFNTGGVFYYTANATSNMTFNFVYDSVTSLNSFMSTGQSLTAAILVSQGGTAYYPTTIKVDNTTITPKWANGTAPSSGDINSIDVYTFSIIKTANATFTILGSATKFA